MRDIAFMCVLLAACGMALRHPWVGIVGWTIISIMNPHRTMWHVTNYPVAAMVAVCTLIGILATRDRKGMTWRPEVAFLVLFTLWMTAMFLFTLYPRYSYDMWDRVMKINFMIVVAIYVMHDRRQIMALAWALVFSLGWFGAKGGLFTLINGGNYRVWGPPDSFIEGNNELALALIVAIPLMQFVRKQTTRAWVRHALLATMALSAFAAIGSHSRGALLAIVAMGFWFWLRSDKKLPVGMALAVLGVALLSVMPAEWFSRMETIESYQDDSSAMGRINAWTMAWNLAVDRFPVGGGFAIYEPDVFMRYAPDPGSIHAAHSIYFQVLGEHGFIGLFLMLAMWLCVWFNFGWLRKHARANPATAWAADLGAMGQVALVGYAVGGAFLSLAYFDLPYNILVLGVVARRWVASRAWEHEDERGQALALEPGGLARRTVEAG
ncbi:MAG: putative O-glycosylation ligase, exosortase A system-associated [Rhodocyclaceae bacterium]